MKVWVLIGTADHECDRVLGVYASEADAEAEAARRDDLPWDQRGFLDRFSVEEHDVTPAATAPARPAPPRSR